MLGGSKCGAAADGARGRPSTVSWPCFLDAALPRPLPLGLAEGSATGPRGARGPPRRATGEPGPVLFLASPFVGAVGAAAPFASAVILDSFFVVKTEAVGSCEWISFGVDRG